MWNYKEPSAPKLSQEFRDAHIVDIKGKDAVTANGLIVLGHEKGIKSLKTKILQFPNKDNDMTCIVEANLVGYGYSPADDKVVEVEFSSIGDANPKNCTSMVAAAFIRMAETRAIGRVMRNYTDIGMLCSDEVGTAIEEQVAYITPAQINIIAGLMKSNGITKEAARTLMLDTCGKPDLRALTESEAEKFIEAMKNYTAA